jgi:predicted GNAT family acetyltransferase
MVNEMSILDKVYTILNESDVIAHPKIRHNGSFSKESNKITESTQVDASELQSNLKTKYPELKNLNLFDRGNDLRLDTIVVKKEHRNQGVGGRVLKDLKDHADKNGKRITLTAGVADPHMGTTSQSRLDKFYKSHGFVANKGRNKDFAITATHYYDGKLDEGFVKNAVGAALIAGAALGINHNLEKPTEVSQQLQIVKKPVPMNHEEAMSHIIKTYHVKPELAHTITTAAFKHGDPNGFPTPHHLLGLMATESSFNPKEVSKLKKDAAIGITQIRPITSGIDPKELTTVDSQVKHTTNILKDFHKRANGDVNMALSSYNNGFRAVYNDRPSVNKNYAPKVLKAVEQFHNPE